MCRAVQRCALAETPSYEAAWSRGVVRVLSLSRPAWEMLTNQFPQQARLVLENMQYAAETKLESEMEYACATCQLTIEQVREVVRHIQAGSTHAKRNKEREEGAQRASNSLQGSERGSKAGSRNNSVRGGSAMLSAGAVAEALMSSVTGASALSMTTQHPSMVAAGDSHNPLLRRDDTAAGEEGGEGGTGLDPLLWASIRDSLTQGQLESLQRLDTIRTMVAQYVRKVRMHE